MSSQPTILLVEDDDQVRSFVRILLVDDGYRVLDAGTGAEGLHVAEKAGHIDLLLSDMLLPEVSGFDLALLLQDKYPGLKIVLMTGYVEGEIVQRCLSELNATFIDKPFQPAKLRSVIRETLSSPAKAPTL